MMAAAEARAAWQRTANRCFVQEDAKRAPKLACGPPPPYSSTNHTDSAPASTADGPQPQPHPQPETEHPTLNFMPLKRNSSNNNLSSDTKWWLHFQPNFAYQKGFAHEPIKPNEAVSETVAAHHTVSTTRLNKKTEFIKRELKVVNGQNVAEFGGVKDDKELCFDSESPWLGTQKPEPWWRVTDQEELASLVARKSLDHIENCDLPRPRPQNNHIRKNPFFQAGCIDDDAMIASCLDLKMGTGLFNAGVCVHSTSPHGKEVHLRSGSEKLSSYNLDKKGTTDTKKITENDPIKAQLLEALRHSQTRAREAEKAAKQANAEKEHVIKLFLRQASHLFAYKQWFHLLQLETFYIKVNKKVAQPESTVPWTTPKARKHKKSRNGRQGRQNGAKEKQGKWGRPKFNCCNHILAIALGLSLVGAGLLLGWTVGWMLPTL